MDCLDDLCHNKFFYYIYVIKKFLGGVVDSSPSAKPEVTDSNQKFPSTETHASTTTETKTLLYQHPTKVTPLL